MSFWEYFQRLEVFKKQLNINKKKKKVNKFWSTPDGVFIKDNVGFIVMYGIVLNFALYLVFGISISILNILSSGCLYYMFVEVVKLLSDKKFILFGWRRNNG